MLESFFREYAAASMGVELARIAAFYSDTFIAAGPRGSSAFRNDEKFLDWLEDVQTFNQKAGMTSMEVQSISEPLRLSEGHVLTHVEWGATFHKTGGQVIRFRIAYLLEKQKQGWKILAYVSEKDQAEEMRELDLLPV